MRIVFFGTPQFAVPSLERLLLHPDFEVMAVVTQPDKRRGRGKQVTPSPVKRVATEADCLVLQPARIKRSPEVIEQLRAIAADAFVVVAYGQILSQAILEIPRLGCVNAHGSLLPAYRGAAPIQWSLYHGETETGVTTMLMDAGMDTGPMLLKAAVPIGLLDTALDLAKTLSSLSAELLVDTLNQLNQGAVTPTPQPDAQATYAPLIQKADYTLNWSKSAIALHNQIRGFYPNCTTQFRGEALKITATLPLGEFDKTQWPESLAGLAQITPELTSAAIATHAKPGEIVSLLKAYGPVVATADGLLLLSEVKPSGKRSQSGADFANGSRLQVGDLLGEAAS
ncbi:methionyl-tRNA formyltransferase [Almyronema epifaneia]|uniref:Methionyl-tRNA formyltransferase n=1 Tax=Almyronema epifaneia S1 TaxID=2991925 RepID=A0ABW6IEX1_9CYAN